MNKKILLGSALALAATSAFAAEGVFETWIGSSSGERVLTGLDNGTGTSGYWYSYNDQNDGGASDVDWNGISLETAYSTNSLLNVIEEKCGVAGTAVLDANKLTYNPFVGIGFNVAGTETEDGGEATPADATAWGGICIAFSADTDPAVELGLGDTEDANIAYDNPAFGLTRNTAGTVKKIAWSDFTQAGWGVTNGGVAITSEEAAAKLASVKFKIQAKTGSYNFNIMSIGPYDGTCQVTTNDCGAAGVKGVRSASAAKAVLSNSMLSFTGITSAASVEIINLQGQVMMKSKINASSTLDLSRLDAGVYMVRVAGKSVDFASKIVLK